MKNIQEIKLTLRQRQILNYLHQTNEYVTGVELSKWLNVSSRTIRNDVSSINEILNDSSIQIVSKHSFGYKIETTNPADFQQIVRISQSFVSKAERIRFIAFELCIKDEPIDVYDLSDSMFISKTTLDHDLVTVKEQFFKPFHIDFFSNKNIISIENDERKKRKLILHLYSKDWDYNGRSNTFYSYEYVSEKLINRCRMEIHYFLDNYDIAIEDVNLVHLILMTAIAHQRVIDGHELQDTREVFKTKIGEEIIDTILDDLEDKWNYSFSRNERPELYEMISCSILPQMSEIEKKGVVNVFDSDLIQFTNKYLKLIEAQYRLNVFADDDFYNTIICYFQYLRYPIHFLNFDNINQYDSQQNLIIEFEIAYSIQPLAKEFYHRTLNYVELFYLSLILSSVFNTLTHKRLNAVILSHLNMPATWNIRKQLEDRFSTSIFITNLLPVYLKDKFDFKNTDLIFSTTPKLLEFEDSKKVIIINPSISTSNVQEIDEYLHNLKFQFMTTSIHKKTIEYLKEAEWFENIQETNYLQLIRKQLDSHIKNEDINKEFLDDILHREKVYSFANHPVYSIVYSSVPAKHTKVEVVTLKHRIKIKNKKIRMVIFLYTTKEDQGLKFLFLKDFFQNNFDANESRFLKTKKEFLPYLEKIML